MAVLILALGGIAAALADVLPRSLWPYVSMTMLGFVLGGLGHLARSRWLVAVGIALVFLGAFLFPGLRAATEEDRPVAADNPRAAP